MGLRDAATLDGMAATMRLTVITEDIGLAREYAAKSVTGKRAARAMISPPLDSIRRGPDGVEAVTEYRVDLETTVDYEVALRQEAFAAFGQNCCVSVAPIEAPSPGYAGWVKRSVG